MITTPKRELAQKILHAALAEVFTAEQLENLTSESALGDIDPDELDLLELEIALEHRTGATWELSAPATLDDLAEQIAQLLGEQEVP